MHNDVCMENDAHESSHRPNKTTRRALRADPTGSVQADDSGSLPEDLWDQILSSNE